MDTINATDADVANVAADVAADAAAAVDAMKAIERSPSPLPLISSLMSSPSPEVEGVTKFDIANLAMNIDASINRLMDGLSAGVATPVPPPPPSTSPPDYQQLYIDSLLQHIVSLQQTVTNQHRQIMLLIESTAPAECAPAPTRSVPAPAPPMPQTVPTGCPAAPTTKAPPTKTPPAKAPAAKAPAAKAPAAKAPATRASAAKSPATAKDRRVEIIGDSMVSGIRPWSKPGFFTKVNSYRGATTTDMVNMADIAMRRRPAMLIVHSGTNDFAHNVQTKNELQRVISKSRSIDPDIIIGISGICYREDDRRLQPKIKDMNNQLKNFCRQHQVQFIEHNDFDTDCLGFKGLHPNDNGNVSIKSDFDRTIRSSLA